MISFILNNETIRTNLPAGMTVLDFIRYHKHLKGTKIGCREGDCGACNVLAGQLLDGEVAYQTMTSCLMPLANASRKHIVTIEGINPSDDSLTPVQSAMVEENGSQCGFCTPGFIVSLTCFCLHNYTVTPEDAISSIDGNICRCTGYKSIERAAEKITSLLNSGSRSTPLDFAIEHKIVPGWFRNIPLRLEALPHEEDGQQFDAKKMIVAGGTDIYVQRGDEMPHRDIVPVFDSFALKEISITSHHIEIGGAVTITDLMYSEVIQNAFPNFYADFKRIGSTPIRNMSTVAGNIVNASPIGDMTIWLLALDATVVVSNGSPREIPLRDFYTGYKKLAKNADEIVEKIYFKIPKPGSFFNFEKVSKRTYLDIATVNTAIYLLLDGDVILDAQVSAGGVSPIPLYLKNTSSCLVNKKIPFTDAIVMELNHIVQSEISPISDVRGSAYYKRLLMQQLFQTHFAELNSPG